MMDRTAARALLVAQCAPSIYPTLTDVQIDDLLDAQQRFTIWKASTAYSYGDVIIPTVPGGHLYECVLAGTTSTTEPFWPTYTSPDDRIGLTRPYWHGFVGPMPGSQLQDGTVVWIEAGPAREMYDVRRATYNAWLQKSTLATADYDTAIDKDQFSRSQVVAHCTDMAMRYRPTGIF